MRIYDKARLSVRTEIVRESVPIGGAGGYSLGFGCGAGRLTSGLILRDENEELPSGAAPAALFCAGGESVSKLLCLVNGETYFRRAGGEYEKTAVRFIRTPRAVALPADGAALLSDGEITALLTENSFAAREDIPPFSAGAWHYERLWLALPGPGGEVAYSAPVNYTDFRKENGGGGSVSFPDDKGKIVALRESRGRLYVFRERGVQRLDARGDERGFELRDLFSCAKIYGDTVADVGGRLVWLGENGAMKYGGNGNPEPFCADFLRNFGCEGASAAAFGDSYALRARHFPDGKFAAVLCGKDGGYFLADTTQMLSVCGGNLYCAAEGKLFSALNGAGRRVWTVPPYSCGGRALLRTASVRAVGDFELTASSEEGERRVLFCGGGEEKLLPLRLAGRSFVFRMETENAGAEILSLRAEYELPGEGSA